MIHGTIDSKIKVAYNGIEGSFSHQVANRYYQGANLMPVPDIKEMRDGLINGKYNLGVVPLVNSGAGAVKSTLDELINHSERIQVTDSHNFLVDQRVGGYCRKKKVKFIISHPTAIKQCKDYLNGEFPGYTAIEEDDTALAIKNLSEAKKSGDHGKYNPENTWVIGSEMAFEMYGVKDCSGHNIADDGEDNTTVFLIVKKRESDQQQ